MMNITPYATDTLEDRRFRLLSRYNENIPYTRKSPKVNEVSILISDPYAPTTVTSWSIGARLMLEADSVAIRGQFVNA